MGIIQRTPRRAFHYVNFEPRPLGLSSKGALGGASVVTKLTFLGGGDPIYCLFLKHFFPTSWPTQCSNGLEPASEKQSRLVSYPYGVPHTVLQNETHLRRRTKMPSWAVVLHQIDKNNFTINDALRICSQLGVSLLKF